jgi:hypothetical protein
MKNKLEIEDLHASIEMDGLLRLLMDFPEDFDAKRVGSRIHEAAAAAKGAMWELEKVLNEAFRAAGLQEIT